MAPGYSSERCESFRLRGGGRKEEEGFFAAPPFWRGEIARIVNEFLFRGFQPQLGEDSKPAFPINDRTR